MRQGIIAGNQVVIKEIVETETKTSSGIIIAKQIIKKPNTQGKIILVGDGDEPDSIKVKEGMIALYPPLSAQKFVLDDEEFHLVSKSRLLFAYRGDE